MTDIYNIITLLTTEDLTLFFIIGSIVEVLIAGFVLRMSITFSGGQTTIPRALLFSLIIKLINIIISLFVPPVFYGVYVLVLNSAIWILLVMKVFKLTFMRAILVALLQLIITFVFTVIGIPLFIQYLKLGVII